MNIDKKIEDLREEFENKIKELKEEYKKENKKGKSEKWIPLYAEEYFYLNARLEIDSDINYMYAEDMNTFRYNKIFKTYEEAQEYADYLKARKEYSYEFSEEEWEDERIDKYSIYYDYELNGIDTEIWGNCRNLSQTLFKTEAQAQAFIDKYRKQILKFEFGIEE